MTKTVRIYRPSGNAMQSAPNLAKKWVLEHDISSARAPEPLMGWVSSSDTLNQIKLEFDTQDEAIAYATSKGWDYCVEQAQDKKIRPRNYMDNFKYSPIGEE